MRTCGNVEATLGAKQRHETRLSRQTIPRPDSITEDRNIDTFNPKQKKSDRLTAEQEKDLARRIHAAEDRAREAVAAIPAAQEELARRPKRAERTRAGMVDRLEAALRQADGKAPSEGAMWGLELATLRSEFQGE